MPELSGNDRLTSLRQDLPVPIGMDELKTRSVWKYMPHIVHDEMEFISI